MRGFKVIMPLMVAMMMSSAAYAQLKIVPGERLREVNSPRLSADSSSIRFDVTHMKASPLSEDDAPAVYRYAFVNAGDKPLQIRSLRTTCTCASASCDRPVVNPGEKGTISVRYDPKGHPGRFERKIFVYTMEGTSPSAVLKLDVEVTVGDDVSGEYPVQMGGIRLRRDKVSFKYGERAVEKIRFMNLTGTPLTLQCEEMFLLEDIGFETRPETVGSGMEGEIVISYEPSSEMPKMPVRLMLKGLGVPPSRSVIKITIE